MEKAAYLLVDRYSSTIDAQNMIFLFKILTDMPWEFNWMYVFSQVHSNQSLILLYVKIIMISPIHVYTEHVV